MQWFIPKSTARREVLVTQSLSEDGARLLLGSGDALFWQLIPWLPLFATELFAAGVMRNRGLARRVNPQALRSAVVWLGLVLAWHYL
ncbi:hypothetical protein [Stappia sp. ES.058]|uniref:hypothetical protein n=1 Tax=Stappia sp. ES.058 TaxID=1881061 RepID=UPI001AD90BE2|nr:hypothetical protein [Stappia sp. ES.058]